MPYRNKQTKTAATKSSAKMEPKMKSLKITVLPQSVVEGYA